MSAKKHVSDDPGPDLLARYLHVYMESRQMTDLERPWGLGDDTLGDVWIRLSSALNSDPDRLNHIIKNDLTADERERMVRTLAPLMFALPLRVFPAQLAASISGNRLRFSLYHDGKISSIGYLPSALETDLHDFLRDTLDCSYAKKPQESIVSAGGRRKRVRIKLFHSNGLGGDSLTIHFVERLPSPMEDR